MFGGANLSAAFVGQYCQHAAFTDDTNRGSFPSDNDYGMVVQGGYLLSEKLEVFGRWEYINAQHVAYLGTDQQWNIRAQL
ncbi:MAG: hypothetical protein EXS00_05635 [Phycisphaerales bacterium]|nr:hypothetical protein [Phycisphaerales bacterium]